jgi:D-alanyl-D-alanine carboxypeptidase (penicillin-binding protein 5/6)
MQGSKMFVAIDSLVAVRDLIPGIIVHSGNDASVVVAEGIAGDQEAFAARMTKKGRDIGMTKTIFTNPDGWPDDRQWTTAHDLAILAQRTIKDFPDFYKQYYSEKEFKYQNYQSQFNRNPLIGKVSGADGLKTGHTEEAGYGLTASVERGGRRIVLVINGLTSTKQRQQESERLVEWAFREFEDYTIFKPGDVVAQADVWMGVAPKVQLTVARDAVMTLPRGARQSMKVTVVYDGPVKAPIKKGDPIGKLVVSGGNAATTEIPLMAAEDVEKMGFVGRIMSGVKYYVLGHRS